MIIIPPNTKGLIFDCDGTLAYTMEAHWKAWTETFDEIGLPCPIDFMDTLRGMPAHQIVETYNKHFETDLCPNEITKKKHDLVISALECAEEVKAVCDIARKYHGVLPMAVASGGAGRNVRTTLKAIGLTELFDVVLTADDPIPAKPNPDIFLEAARLIGCDPKECLVFEDGEQGFAAAKAADIPCVDVRPHYS